MILFAGLGGVLGAAARYGIGRWVAANRASAFPWATLWINITGSLLLGIFFSLHQQGSIPLRLWQFAGAGFCGSYTTFSTFGCETVDLIRRGKKAHAAGYVLGSWLFGLLFAWIGVNII